MVAVPHTDPGVPVERGRADELAVLYEIIHTVTSTLDLEAVLAAIVRLVNDAIVAHATYVFLAEEGGRRIVLRAASEQYAHLCGRVSMGAGEGIAGWVLENRQPVFINEDVLSDPRVKYFPELEEEKYQSLVSVPLVLKGDRMIGVIALHAEAPRVFSAEDAAFLIHVASLVAHAIENARLYERTRRSLRELEHLSRLGAAIARSESIDDLLVSAVEVGRTLVRAESLGVYLVEASGDSLRLRAAAGGDVEGPEVVSLPDLGMELRRSGAPGASLTSVLAGTLWGAPAMRSALVAPLVAGEEVLGFLVARLADGRRASEHDRELANSLASQTAVGLKRLQLTDRLAERNRIKDLFDDLASGIGGPALAGRARRLGIDP
jgi:GAF domain-containing protein